MKTKTAVKLGEFVLKHKTTRKIAAKVVKHEIKKKAKELFKGK